MFEAYNPNRFGPFDANSPRNGTATFSTKQGVIFQEFGEGVFAKNKEMASPAKMWINFAIRVFGTFAVGTQPG